jgi:antitoxin CptB
MRKEGVMVNESGDSDQGARASSQRARLYWQCRRGMLELDLVLQSFLDQRYDQADADERRAFEALLNYPDPLLLEYVMGHMMPADPAIAHVVARLRGTSAA